MTATPNEIEINYVLSSVYKATTNNRMEKYGYVKFNT